MFSKENNSKSLKVEQAINIVKEYNGNDATFSYSCTDTINVDGKKVFVINVKDIVPDFPYHLSPKENSLWD